LFQRVTDIDRKVAWIPVTDFLHKVLNPDDGGLIALGADGAIVMDYTTAGMARAAADSSGRREVKIGR
jgi:beta-aspartyl-peptidase (threonine type)